MIANYLAAFGAYGYIVAGGVVVGIVGVIVSIVTPKYFPQYWK